MHAPFGHGDPNGNSWSEKFNVWLHTVVASDGRERRFQWETWQQGVAWLASLVIRAKLHPEA